MIPANSATVTDWYKQSVYDPKDNKVGEIMDVLLDKSGKVTSLIVGVGGFLGAGEKDVSVPFDAVHVTNKNNNKWYLVMNATKDELKRATGFTYDKEFDNLGPGKEVKPQGIPLFVWLSTRGRVSMLCGSRRSRFGVL